MSYAVDRVLRYHPDLTGMAEYVRQNLRMHSYVGGRYVFYAVPKAACTTVLTLIHRAEGLGEVSSEMAIHDRDAFRLPSLVDVSDAEQERLLSSPEVLRLAVIRHPVPRFLSAWRDKGAGASLRRFIHVVSRCDRRTCNVHWRSQSAHVFHPALDLTYGRVESLPEAVGLLFSRSGLPPLTVPWLNRSREGSDAVDADSARQICALYAEDFSALGY